MSTDKKATPTGDKSTIILPVFEFDRPGPEMHLRSLAFPPRWITLLKKAWHQRGKPSGWNLPTTSLIELMSSLDVHILGISRNIHDEHWIRAYRDVDPTVIHIAVATWAATAVTPDDASLDWEELLDPGLLRWQDEHLVLAEWGTRANGTADVSPHTYQLLPAYLASTVVDQGLLLGGVERKFVLGPLDPGGPRSAVSWPPEKLPGKKAGDAWWSIEIVFRVRTVPGHPVPRVHATLGVVRYSYEPVVYVPGKPKGVTLWMFATQGALRSKERPTLLAATAGCYKVAGEWAWRWNSRLARTLGNLTTRAMPDPAAVLHSPRDHHPDAVGDGLAAMAIYRNGTKLALPTTEEAGDDAGKPKAKHFLHEAGTGFQPGDHIEVHEELGRIFKSAGLIAAGSIERRKSTAVGDRLPRQQLPDQHYHLELWTQPGDTLDALLTVITHEKGLGLEPGPTQEGRLSFTGDYGLSVSLHSIGRLADGISARLESDDDPAASRDAEHATAERIGDIIETLPPVAERTAALVEIDKPLTYLAQGRVDPYKAIKLGFLRSGRLPQCLHPIRKQPDPAPKATQPDDGEAKASKRKEKADRRLDGTQYRPGDAKRAVLAISDSLRQLGRSAVPPPLPGIDGHFEVTGIWLEQRGKQRVPIIVTADRTGAVRARLVDIGELTVAELPAALDAGHGRLDPEVETADRQLAGFITSGLDPDATHDRLVLLRAANIRNRGWRWLQDQHITRDSLVLPGHKPDTRGLSPADLPGLRFVRLREHDNDDEVPRAFVSYWDTKDDDPEPIRRAARTRGVFPFSDWVFYGIAPRSDQAQTPLSVSKLDPLRAVDARKPGYNSNPLEIVTAFLQPGDAPLDWAAYTQSLRRAHLHTDIATVFPVPLHHARLAADYLM